MSPALARLWKGFPVRATSHEDRVFGCLLGGAVGDAFGYGVEFDSLRDIRARFGPRGILQPVLNAHGEAEVSDDTQMTLFTLEGLLAGMDPTAPPDPDAPFDPPAPFDLAGTLEAVRLATLDWHGAQTGRTDCRLAGNGLSKYAVLRKRQAPGGTCLGACAKGAWGTPEQAINDSKGCGGVMRVAPVGLFTELSHELAFELAARCAAQTHGHPSGYLSAGVLASMVRDLLDGMEPRVAVRRGLEVARRWSDADETCAAVERALELAGRSSGDRADAAAQADRSNSDRADAATQADRSSGEPAHAGRSNGNRADAQADRSNGNRADAVTQAGQSSHDHADAVARIGEGWVGEEALAIAVYATLAAEDYSDAMRIASNHDGDSDSTASIAGQLHGAWKGLDGIPNAWIRRLDALDPLLDVANRLVHRVRSR